MENELTISEKCISYLRGEASQELINEVEFEKNANPEFKRIFDETTLILEGFRIQKKYEDARSLFKHKKTLSFSVSHISLAATIFIVGIFSFLGSSKAYFPDLKTTKSVLMSVDSSTNENINLTPQAKAYALFIEGKGLYETQEFDVAIKKFNEALQVPNLRNQLQEAIKWYSCVANLRAGKIDEANSLFIELNKLPQPKYSVGFLTKAKIRFQLFWKGLF